MTQEEEFRGFAADAAARAEAATVPEVRTCYLRLAESYARVADAYAIRPGCPAAPSDARPQAARLAAVFASPAEMRQRSSALRQVAEERRDRLLAAMRVAAAVQRRHRELELETEMRLLRCRPSG